MKIVTRAEWGFDGWLNGNTPYAVDEKAKRTEFFVHYEGANPVLSQTGKSVPRDIHAYHKRQGWKGIGYGHVVDANGTIYEGRGFNMVGSHCPDHNTSGYSVQFHLGGNEKPTAAQIEAGRWLYAESCRRSGRRLAIKGHRDGFATACPGPNLYALVKDGTFASAPAGSGGGSTTNPTPGGSSGGTTFEEDDMPEPRDLWAYEYKDRQALGYLVTTDANARAARKYAGEALGIVKALAAKPQGLTPEEIAAAAKQGAKEALAEEIDGATVNLEVQK